MALRALDCMKNDGRAAIIIGGHTEWDEQGRIQAGKNRLFFNYLYSHYNVEDVIQIDGQKLYSRQGTSFDVRLILIRGRKVVPEGFAPLKDPYVSTVVNDFETLWNRVFDEICLKKENCSIYSNTTIKMKLKMKAKALELSSLYGYYYQKRKPLSAYSIADNCADIIDINDAIDEIRDAIKEREIQGIKIPNFYYLRLAKLKEKAMQLQNESVDGGDSFNSKIKNYFEDKLDDFYINLGVPGETLLACGLPNDNIVITKRTLHLKVIAHSLSLENLLDLPKKINNPLMVFDSFKIPGAILIFIEDFNGEGLMSVAIHPYTSSFTVNEVNEIATIGGRRFSQLISYLESDAIKYHADIKKIKDFFLCSQFNSAQSEKILNSIQRYKNNLSKVKKK